jgi:glutathione S-transferase
MLKLHGFAQSGNTFKVAFLLRALGVPWQPVAMSFAEFAGGATRDPAWREGVNAMGEVPVLELDDGRKITQSGVILTMLAEQHGKFGGRNADEKLEVLRWLFYDNHKFTSYFATWRFMKSFARRRPTRHRRLPEGPHRQRVRRRRQAPGRAPVHRRRRAHDRRHVALGLSLLSAEESGYVLEERFRNLAAWRDRLKTAPGWGDPYEVLPGERVAPKW